ncbi:MAG: SCO family protein [Rhodocyclaceae bacterium]
MPNQSRHHGAGDGLARRSRDRSSGTFRHRGSRARYRASACTVVRAFHPSCLGLYGDKERTRVIAPAFKVFYQKGPGRTATSYSMAHTAGIYVIDPQRRLRLDIRHGEERQNITYDLSLLLDDR